MLGISRFSTFRRLAAVVSVAVGGRPPFGHPYGSDGSEYWRLR